MKILPYEQGYLDGLCGVYATINSLRLIENKMSEKEAMKLFSECLRHVEKRKGLGKVCTAGIVTNDISSILREVVTVKYEVKVKRPFNKTDEINVNGFFKEVRKYFEKGTKRSVIISIEGYGWDHWTVLKSLTPKSLMLFDSAMMKTVLISKCTFNKQTKRKPYLINFQDTFFLYQEEN